MILVAGAGSPGDIIEGMESRSSSEHPRRLSTLGVLWTAGLGALACSGDGASSGTRGTGGAADAAGMMGGAAPGAGGTAGRSTSGAGGGGGSATGAGGVGGNAGAGVGASGGTGGLGSGAGGGSAGTSSIDAGGDAPVNARDASPAGEAPRADGAASEVRPASGAVCSGHIFCEDFESLTLGGMPSGAWRTRRAQYGSAAGDVVRVDDKHAFSGKQSVFFGSSAGGPTSTINPTAWKPWAADELYGRIMLYFEDIPGRVAGQPDHAPIVRGSGPVAGGGNAAVHIGANNLPMGRAAPYSLFFGLGCDTARTAQKVEFAKGRWLCYEWLWNRKTNGFASWLDGAALMGLEFTKASAQSGGACWTVPQVTSMDFGWLQNHATTDKLSMWLDAIAISDKRVGCPEGAGR